MSHGKRNSKRKGRTKAVTLLGVAGALSLAGGASRLSVGPLAGDTLTANTAVTLHEEEISDVSLSTFYVFDNENAGPPPLFQKLRLAFGAGAGCGCSCGCACGGGGWMQPPQPPYPTQPTQHLKKKPPHELKSVRHRR
jgi:hypothetical protein